MLCYFEHTLKKVQVLCLVSTTSTRQSMCGFDHLHSNNLTERVKEKGWCKINVGVSLRITSFLAYSFPYSIIQIK